MLIEDFDLPIHCGSRHPILNTWDKNEMRSIFCPECKLSTDSFWGRAFAYDHWYELTQSPESDPRNGANKDKGNE